MKSSQYTPDHPEYVPLSVVLMSVYFAGFFESFCVFLVILGSGAVVSALGLSALSLSLYQATKTVLISYLIFPLVRALVQRPLVVRAQHPSPGGRLFAAYEILVPPPVYLVVALAVTQDIGRAVVVGVCALVFYLAYAARFKPWKPGFTRTEVRSKIEQTKQMTREMFGEAAQERAETMQKSAEVDDPAVKDLFLPDNRYRMPLDHDERRS
ncbi:hypothetical protein HMPREF3164_08985 [Rothia sp. HMSC08A08]|uniref:hypothetical protein n=1 Tax=Rothia sp. HMSC08A08 TaxID=1581132 RepID=UPI0008A4F58C|nr:hypothetical protein [Rothia sp. HMSC08A08]OFS78028.1 hypothetical protein HMPREF3164_08985 [Rothia sp. HMSC08A08]